MNARPAFLLAVISASVTPVMADILYVNNDTAYPADYRTFDDAFAAAAAGDTIMLAASTTSYGTINIVGKPIKLVGNKCININAPGQPARADEETTKIGTLFIGVTGGGGEARLLANGTVIESLEFQSYAAVWSDGCTIKKCNMSFASVYGSGNLFSDCYFRSNLYLRRHQNGATPPHVSPGTNNHIKNCILRDLYTYEFTSGQFVNCVIGFAASPPDYNINSGSTVTLRNCIMDDSHFGSSRAYQISTKFNSGGTRLHNCLLVRSEISGSLAIPSLSSELNNLTATSSTLVFSDNFYNLKEGSLAIGTGENGVDMGIFGGPTPYQYGGSPALPLINKLNILEANPTTGLTFQVEAEARD